MQRGSGHLPSGQLPYGGHPDRLTEQHHEPSRSDEHLVPERPRGPSPGTQRERWEQQQRQNEAAQAFGPGSQSRIHPALRNPATPPHVLAEQGRQGALERERATYRDTDILPPHLRGAAVNSDDRLTEHHPPPAHAGGHESTSSSPLSRPANPGPEYREQRQSEHVAGNFDTQIHPALRGRPETPGVAGALHRLTGRPTGNEPQSESETER